MSKVLILGNFGYRTNHLDGQTIKTRNVLEMFRLKSRDKVSIYDTSKFKASVFQPILLVRKILTSKSIVLIPADYALESLFPILYKISKIFKKEIIHLGVGGWQVEFFEGNEKFKPHLELMEQCKTIKGFLVEIKKVEKELIQKHNFTNCEVFPNFRIFDYHPKIVENNSTLKLVFMARVHRNKGYELIFDFIKENKNKDILIDFYGPINEDDKEHFLNLVEQNKDLKVSYKGVLSPEDIHSTLSTYDALLLPTRYFTEGFPGSILDAYIAGIPVIVTEWKHAHEFVDDTRSGFVVQFKDPYKEFSEKILQLYDDRDLLYKMKQNSHKKSVEYSVDSAWNVISKYL